jgi:hypothetical protein
LKKMLGIFSTFLSDCIGFRPARSELHNHSS